jgi:hypothetical protein
MQAEVRGMHYDSIDIHEVSEALSRTDSLGIISARRLEFGTCFMN